MAAKSPRTQRAPFKLIGLDELLLSPRNESSITWRGRLCARRTDAQLSKENLESPRALEEVQIQGCTRLEEVKFEFAKRITDH